MVNKMDVRKVNEELVSFWNNAIKMDDSQKQEIEKSEFECIELAPSEKLCKAIETYKYAKHMLDYGCGNGWASIIGAKSGIEKVTSVDMGDAIIDSCKFLSHKFKVDGKIDAFKIDEDWLKKEEDEKYEKWTDHCGHRRSGSAAGHYDLHGHGGNRIHRHCDHLRQGGGRDAGSRTALQEPVPEDYLHG